MIGFWHTNARLTTPPPRRVLKKVIYSFISLTACCCVRFSLVLICKVSVYNIVDSIGFVCTPRYATIRVVPYLRRLVTGFPPRWSGFQLGSGHVGFVVNKVALGQVFFEYFVPPASYSTDCATLIIIRGWYNRPVAASVIVSVPLHPKKLNKICNCCSVHYFLWDHDLRITRHTHNEFVSRRSGVFRHIA
jgi:hypothetical protein